jgi:hypothetical protein
VGFIGWYFPGAGVPAPVTLGAVVTASVLWATGRRRERERLFGHIYAMVLVQTLLFFAYVESSVDLYDDVNHYVGFFYLTVPVVLIATALAHAVTRASSALTFEAMVASATSRRRAGRIAAIGTALVLIAATASVSQPPDKFLHGFDYAQLVRRLAADPVRDGRVMAIAFDHDLWAQAAGVAIAAGRAGVPWCAFGTDPEVRVLFTDQYTCTSVAADWRLTMISPQRLPAGSDPIYVGSLFAVVASH